MPKNNHYGRHDFEIPTLFIYFIDGITILVRVEIDECINYNVNIEECIKKSGLF